MINHIWVALVVIAITYAMVKDVAYDPPYRQTSPQIIESFEGPPPDDSVAYSSETFFLPGDAEGTTGSSLALMYDFAEEQPADSGTLGLTLEPSGLEEGATGLRDMRARVWSDGGGHNLLAVLLDADGEVFFSRFSSRLTWAEDWRPGTFDLASGALVPAPENPAASPNAPYVLDRFLLQRSGRGSSDSGVVYIDNIELRFLEQYSDRVGVEAKSYMAVLTESSARWAGISIDLAINLIGIMMLWLGIMRIGEKAGVVQFIARVLKPIMTRLFPDIPAESEAMGAIIMNVSANMLGLGNAATPLGLKAMEELQKLNPNKKYASNAMCMLLALNTSSVTLITPAIIGFRSAAGSTNLMIFLPVMILSTVTSTTAAIIACKLLERLEVFRIPDNDEDEEEEART